MRIAIIVREETLDRCTGKGCFNAFFKRIDAFKDYKDNVELVSFTHNGGDIDYKIQKLIDNNVKVIHLSSCMRAKSKDYESLAEKLSKYFDVVGYTHGSVKGKNKEAICLKKIDND
ncbi:hypothetical protein SH2C18_49860 [Clostridium sediminicola]|uniref:CGGC domain-containing protein n=1 Tax=Clostridium sediminicola TaxID=3114879 RepID=UPI0031F21637